MNAGASGVTVDHRPRIGSGRALAGIDRHQRRGGRAASAAATAQAANTARLQSS